MTLCWLTRAGVRNEWYRLMPIRRANQRRQHMPSLTCIPAMIFFPPRDIAESVYRPKEHSLKSMTTSNDALVLIIHPHDGTVQQQKRRCNKCWRLYESAKPPQGERTKIHGSHYSQSRYSLSVSGGCIFGQLCVARMASLFVCGTRKRRLLETNLPKFRPFWYSRSWK